MSAMYNSDTSLFLIYQQNFNINYLRNNVLLIRPLWLSALHIYAMLYVRHGGENVHAAATLQTNTKW